MSHRAADDLSNAIDQWLSRGDLGRGEGLEEIIDSVAAALPPVADAAARERVRRRLATVSPHPRTAQEILLERAVEELDRLQHRLREEDYVPWSGVATAAVIVVAAVGIAIWLRRKGIDQALA